MKISLFELSWGKHYFNIYLLQIGRRALFGICYNWHYKHFEVNFLFLEISYWKSKYK